MIGTDRPDRQDVGEPIADALVSAASRSRSCNAAAWASSVCTHRRRGSSSIGGALLHASKVNPPQITTVAAIADDARRERLRELATQHRAAAAPGLVMAFVQRWLATYGKAQLASLSRA